MHAKCICYVHNSIKRRFCSACFNLPNKSICAISSDCKKTLGYFLLFTIKFYIHSENFKIIFHEKSLAKKKFYCFRSSKSIIKTLSYTK